MTPKYPFENFIVVEFSLSQKSFHTQTVEDMFFRNIKNTMQRVQTDYIPIEFFEDQEEADEFVRTADEMIKNYALYKNINGQTVTAI